MSRFVVETTYHLPVYRQRIYEAASVEEACRLAVDDEGWEDEETDLDTSGETFVTGIWENAERAYQGMARMIPAAFQETIQRKADLFERLVVLIREPARPMGLSRREFERWLPKVQAALVEADAIDDLAAVELPKIPRAANPTSHERLPPLTEEEVNALQDYAAKHGRCWKSILNRVWMGEAPYDDGGVLRRLRITHGPTWLDRYRLPKRQADR